MLLARRRDRVRASMQMRSQRWQESAQMRQCSCIFA